MRTLRSVKSLAENPPLVLRSALNKGGVFGGRQVETPKPLFWEPPKPLFWETPKPLFCRLKTQKFSAGSAGQKLQNTVFTSRNPQNFLAGEAGQNSENKFLH